MNGETESHIFPIKPCKVWHLDRENGLLSHHCSCQASSPSTAAQSTSCLSTFAVEHLHNQPQTSQAANYTSGAWRSSVELQMCNWSQGLESSALLFPAIPHSSSQKAKQRSSRIMLGTDLAQAFTPWRRLAVLDGKAGSRDSVCTCRLHRHRGSPQQNYSPDCSRAAICSLHSILITLRETLTCRSQCAATSAAQLYRAGGLSSHPFVDWFLLLQCSDT